MQVENEGSVKTRIDYQLLLTEISRKQGLGTTPLEMPLIIHTDLTTYTMAYIMYEDEDFLVIIVPDKDGAELAKILNKNTILSIEVIYAQMLKPQKQNPKGDAAYG